MSDLLIKGLLIVAVVVGLIAGYNAFASHQQAIGYQNAVADYTKQENADLKAALTETIRLNGVVKEATDAALEREKNAQRLTDRIGVLTARLRDSKDAIDRLVPGASCDAARHAVTALNGLFKTCLERYQGMGQAAFVHSSDVATLTASWPVQPAGGNE